MRGKLRVLNYDYDYDYRVVIMEWFFEGAGLCLLRCEM
jgi:hypothetical protein